ncbi:hypothetical protein [Flavihumibacter petaseus]|uniref:Uncharacterized protein n=1 Tax=Flavihumibacter petaseus NBRC 106054 TaxID=1220578 RepID=A0A0E9N4A9_9BACT|nr:hypothetical protein [Flavihumibacter petaseus]GAO44200.1 hypothetical protein FPE01S_03_02380 [Flavihumibacter petaseus NBRC 106054]
MGLFNFFKKNASPQPEGIMLPDRPYADESLNLLYNLLFCDVPELFRLNTGTPESYPVTIIFAEQSGAEDLKNVANDPAVDSRYRILACNRLRLQGSAAPNKALLGVIVEVGLDQGLDVLASFADGTARYINQSGKMVIWEAKGDQAANALRQDLFDKSRVVIEQIGPWEQPRRPHPAAGTARITFLVSDGLYFGEAPINTLFGDPLAAPALDCATRLMQFLATRASAQ